MSYMSVLCRALQQVIDSKLITAIGPQPPANVCLTGASTAPATPGLTNNGLTPHSVTAIFKKKSAMNYQKPKGRSPSLIPWRWVDSKWRRQERAGSLVGGFRSNSYWCTLRHNPLEYLVWSRVLTRPHTSLSLTSAPSQYPVLAPTPHTL